MQYRKLGQSEIEASAVAFGAWAIGGWMWGGTDQADSVQAIHAALDAGINFIDTAPVYGFGLSEEIIGKAIADRRDKVILATKCGLVWDRTDGEYYFSSDGKSKSSSTKFNVYRYLGRDSIFEEVEKSLKRLRTDHIDLYQTHWQDPTTPIEETMTTLMDLKKQGKIRAIGLSNATVEHLEEYRKFGPIDTDQERYSMIDRKIESQLLPYCHKNNIAMLAYSPMEQGLLTGKITPNRKFAPGDQRADNPKFSPQSLAQINIMLNVFRPIAQTHNITLAQLTIAWTIAQPGLTHALCGARNAQQATENAAAADVQLTPDELTAMNTAIQNYLQK